LIAFAPESQGRVVARLLAAKEIFAMAWRIGDTCAAVNPMTAR
jgi:hypothetical protein